MVKKDWMKTDNGNYIPNLKKWTVTKPAKISYSKDTLKNFDGTIQYPILRKSKRIYAEEYPTDINGHIRPCVREDVVVYQIEVEWHPKLLVQCPYCKKEMMSSYPFNLNRNEFSIFHIIGCVSLWSKIKFEIYNCEHNFDIVIPYDGIVKKLYVFKKEKKQWERINDGNGTLQ